MKKLYRPKNTGVLEQLLHYEKLMIAPVPGETTLAFYDTLLAGIFRETGASGKLYSREEVLQVLEKRLSEPHTEPYIIENAHYVELSPRVFILTYTLTRGGQVSSRSSIWKKDTNGYQILYHHGTPVTAN